MNQVATPATLSDEAPGIDWISATGQCAPKGGTVVLKSQAHDPDGTSDTSGIGWAWEVTCGSLSTPVSTVAADQSYSASTATFTAPTVDSTCTVNITASDARLPAYLQTKASYSISVGGACDKGNAKIVALPNVCPVIQDLRATPVPLNVGVATTLTVTSTDADQDVMTYAWTTDCDGTFVPSAVVANPTFTLNTSPTSLNCGFQVVVTDGTWASGNLQGQTKCSISNHLSMPVFNPNQAPILGCTYGYDYMSNDTISGGDMVKLEIVAPSTGCAAGWHTVWSSSDSATLAPIASPVAPFTTGVTYTAAAGAEDGQPVVVTVASDCPGSTSIPPCSHTFTLVPKNSFCFGKADGTQCDSQDKCLQGTACNGGVCTGTAKTCTPSTDACKVNACVSTTGDCTLSDKPDNTLCDDGVKCTEADKCTAGACHGTAKVCSGTVAQCQVNACVESTGLCTPSAAPDGTACSDGNGCTGTSVGPGTSGAPADVCSNGSCQSGGAVTCTAPLACTSTGAATYVCEEAVCLAPNYAVATTPLLNSLAAAPSGTSLWSIGNIYTTTPFDFGAGTVTSTGSADVYLNKLNPATGMATQSFIFGFTGGGDQNGNLVSVAAVTGGERVLASGTYLNRIVFKTSTPVKQLSGSSNTAGAALNYWVVMDAASTMAAQPTVIKARNVDLGNGAFLAVASNPSQSKFAICGKTTADPGVYDGTDATNSGLTTVAGTFGGGADLVVAVVDATTGDVTWGQMFGGIGDQICDSVAMDSSGNVVIGGHYNGALSFGTGHAFTTQAVNPTLGLPFVAKFDATGNCTAAATWGTGGSTTVSGVGVDSSGNVVMAGGIGTSTNANFGAPVGVLTSAGGTDGFAVKLNPGLTAALWGSVYGDLAADATKYDQAVQAMAVAASGDVLVSGAMVGHMVFPGAGGGTLTSTGNLANDAFTVRLNGSTGDAICAKRFGDSASQAASIVTGPTSNAVYYGGNFNGSMTIGSGAGAITLSSGVTNGWISQVKIP